MDYTILQAELTQAAYAGLSDQVAADALNAATVQRVRRVPLSELTSLAFGMGLTVRLRVVIRTPAAPIELVAVCESLLDLLSAPFDSVDIWRADGTSDPATAGMLDALIEAGLLAKEERAMIEALGVETVSRATILGLGEVTALDVSRARGGAW